MKKQTNCKILYSMGELQTNQWLQQKYLFFFWLSTDISTNWLISYETEYTGVHNYASDYGANLEYLIHF